MVRTKFPVKSEKTYGKAYHRKVARPGSVPVKWNETRTQLAFDYAFLGATDAQIAELMDASPQTIEYWKRTRPEFRRMLDKGRRQANARVARSLYEVAIGYSHPDTVILSNRVKVYDKSGRVIEEHTEPLLVPIIKHYKPDAWAAFKILTIRERILWADIQKTELTSTINVNIKKIDFAAFSDKELRSLRDMGMKQLQIPENGSRSN